MKYFNVTLSGEVRWDTSNVENIQFMFKDLDSIPIMVNG